jgi:hypothetical protein
MRIEIINGFVLGTGKAANVGDVLDVPPPEAARWIRLGFAQPVEVDPETAEVVHDNPRHAGRGSRRNQP